MANTGSQIGRRESRGRPFAKGRSGNPAGRPVGALNKATLAAEMLLDGEAEELTRRAIESALAGNDAALRLCLDRILAPRRQRSVRFPMPPVTSAADLAAVAGAVLQAVASGELTTGEASELSQVVQTFINAIETSDFERRLRMIETGDAAVLGRVLIGGPASWRRWGRRRANSAAVGGRRRRSAC